MNTENTVLKQEESFRISPCKGCNKPRERKIRNGKPESQSKYDERSYCTFECWKQSLQPPTRYCPICKNKLVRGEKEALPDYRARIFCGNKCKSIEFARRVRKQRLKNLQKPRCTVEGCDQHVMDGLHYLCQYHFLNADHVPIHRGRSIISQKDLWRGYKKAVKEMRKNLAKRVLQFTWAEYKQDELEFYLMTPTQRQEARRNYDRQERSER